jgi:hypothetical protein
MGVGMNMFSFFKNMKTQRVLASLVMLVFTIIFAGACRRTTLTRPPFIPPDYLNCIEVTAKDLLDSYYTPYMGVTNIEMAQAKYNNLIYVFKNVLVKDWVIADLDKGWIWVDRIRCVLANINDMKQFKVGDKIDVIGLNKGIISNPSTQPGLLFDGCIVIAAGTVALASGGGSGLVFGGY